MPSSHCKDCGESIDQLARRCLNCGRPTALRQLDEFFGIELLLVLIVFGLAFRAL